VGVEALPGAFVFETERLPLVGVRPAGPLRIGAAALRRRAVRGAEGARRLESEVVVLELLQQNARAVAGVGVPLPDRIAAAVEYDAAGSGRLPARHLRRSLRLPRSHFAPPRRGSVDGA